MQCPNCFAQLPEDAISCEYCGSQFYNQMQYTPDANNASYQYNQAYPNYQDMNQYNQDGQAQGYNHNVAPQAGFGYDNYVYNQQPMTYQPTTPTGSTSNGGKKGPNKVLLVSIISFSIVAFILGIALIIKGGKDKDSKKTTESTTEMTTTQTTTTEATTTEKPTTEATTTEATTTQEPTTEAVVVTDGYNGKYVFTHYVQDDELIPVSDVAASTGADLDMCMIIYDNTCLLMAPSAGKVYCDFTIENGVVSMDDGVEVVNGTYNEEDQTIIMEYNDTTMLYALEPWDGTTYDMVGDYTLAYATYGTEVYDLETLREKMGDPEYSMTMTVYGVICTLTSFENGSINVASTYMESMGTTLFFEDGEGTLIGHYDPDAKTITMYTNGVDLTFELDGQQ